LALTLRLPAVISRRPPRGAGLQHGACPLYPLGMVARITSPANPTIKMLKSLHLKKARAETGLFLGEGLRLATEAAALGIWPEWLAVSSASLERGAALALAKSADARGVKVVETSEAILAAIAKRDNPQTVIGAWRQTLSPLSALSPHAQSLIIALDSVRDPGNLGTILRTADTIGADAVVLTGGPCDPFSVEAVRASMGSLFAVKLVRCSIDDLVRWKQAHGLMMVGAHLHGSVRHDDFPVDRGIIVLMGTEQSGLPDATAALCDVRVRIPMRGRADSLNLAIATAVLSYDVWRRRGYAGAPS
jgi:TrmH family RNA methyltransferase